MKRKIGRGDREDTERREDRKENGKGEQRGVASKFAVVDAEVEVADGVEEEEFELEMRDGGEPLLKGALFAEAEEMGPVVEDEDCTIRETMREITQAIEGGFVDIAIDAGEAEFISK